MNLSELQSIKSTERQADSLQRLRASFYADAGEFISELRAERAAAVEAAANPFGDEEVRRLTDDIETARSTVEAIYERRVGKVVRMASLAAADMPTEEEGLTAEEAELFEELVAAIRENRREVMTVVDEAADGAEDLEDVTPDVATDAASVEAADLMGGEVADESDGGSADETVAGRSASAAASSARQDVREVPPDENPPGERRQPPEDASTDGPGSPAEAGAVDEATPGGDTGDEAAASPDEGLASDRDADVDDDVARRTVRITRDVGEIFGVDDRAYDLSTDDVVTLPAANAEPLVADDAAEPLE